MVAISLSAKKVETPTSALAVRLGIPLPLCIHVHALHCFAVPQKIKPFNSVYAHSTVSPEPMRQVIG